MTPAKYSFTGKKEETPASNIYRYNSTPRLRSGNNNLVYSGRNLSLKKS